MNKSLKRIFCFIIVLLIINIFYSVKSQFSLSEYVVDDISASFNYDKKLTKEEAIEDLDIIWNAIKSFHIIYLDDSKKYLINDLEEKYKKEKQNLNSSVSVGELWKISSKIVSVLHDAHTRISYIPTKDRYTTINDTIIKTNIVKINGFSANELFNNYKEQTSYELEPALFSSFIDNLTKVDVLEFVGIDTSNGVNYTMRDNTNLFFDSKDFIVCDNKSLDYMNYSITDCSFELLEDCDLGIIILNKCEITENNLIKIKKFFSDIENSEINNIAIDLRNNLGGDSSIADEFLKYIDVDSYYLFDNVVERDGFKLYDYPKTLVKNDKNKICFKGNIYILTSYKTFSSATLFAMIFQDNNIGKIVGETPGNMPSAYGEVKRVQLPNSQLILSVSTKYFERVDKRKRNEPLQPDYVVPSKDALKIVTELALQ